MDGSGRLAATTARAAEINALGHGVFTYALLEGLKGAGGTKKVTVEGGSSTA